MFPGTANRLLWLIAMAEQRCSNGKRKLAMAGCGKEWLKNTKVSLIEYGAKIQKRFHHLDTAANYFAKKITKGHSPVTDSTRRKDMFYQ